MNFTGEEKLAYKREAVWAALHDPEFLKKVIPGCSSITVQNDGDYLIELELGIAAVKGRFSGKASINDHEVPRHYTMKAEGSGGPGFVKIKMDCFLEAFDNDQCTMKWESEVEAGGLIAGIGGRVLSGVAKYMTGQFFGSVRKTLATFQVQA